MQLVDLENQSLVGMVLVLDAIATEVLLSYLNQLPANQRQAVCDRMTAQVAANGKQLVDLAPKAQIANATKIQAAAARLIKAALAEIATSPKSA